MQFYKYHQQENERKMNASRYSRNLIDYAARRKTENESLEKLENEFKVFKKSNLFSGKMSHSNIYNS